MVDGTFCRHSRHAWVKVSRLLVNTPMAMVASASDAIQLAPLDQFVMVMAAVDVVEERLEPSDLMEDQPPPSSG